jgi:hypothetical protein
MVFALITALLAFNLAAFIWLVWEQRAVLSSVPVFVFSCLFLIVFLAEQVAVGGNVPFWERYVLQIGPFLGILSFAAVRSVSAARIAVLAAFCALGNVMLWRYAFVH